MGDKHNIWVINIIYGYYYLTCEKKINCNRQWVGGSGPGRAFFFQGC